MLARARALLIPLVFVPLATGCTLWYLASDPFDGVGDGVDGSTSANGDSSLDADASPDGVTDGGSDCGPLDSVDNCGACGVKCGASSQCLVSTVEVGPSPYHCSASEVSTLDAGFVTQAIAVWGPNLYVVDTNGGVWACDGTCDTDSFTQLAAPTASETGCYITASSKGLFWSTLSPDGVRHIDFDGGAHPPFSAVSPQVVSAAASRVAWTSGTDTRCRVFDKPPVKGTVFFQMGTAFSLGDGGPNISSAADLRNVAFIDDGTALAWTTGEESLQLTTLFADGGIGTVKDFGDAGGGDLVIASNGQDLALTSEAAHISGGVFDLSATTGLSLKQQTITNQGLNGAPVFFGDTQIYWSDTATSISYCTANPTGTCNTTTIQHGETGTLQEIAANGTHIFFTMGGNTGAKLYRIDPLPTP